MINKELAMTQPPQLACQLSSHEYRWMSGAAYNKPLSALINVPEEQIDAYLENLYGKRTLKQLANLKRTLLHPRIGRNKIN